MSTVKAGLDNGSIKRFASLEELAQNYGIDPKLLKESVDRWNDAIAKKTDPDFKAKIFDDTEANEGTFFACRLWPRVHYCMGGLTINAKAEVIDTDFNILPGLFAAGEVCGGVHGMVRLAPFRSPTVSFMAASPVRQPPIARRNPFKLDDSGACPPIGCLNRQAFIIKRNKTGHFSEKKQSFAPYCSEQ